MPSPQGAGFYKVVLRISYMAACCTVVFVYVSVFTNEFTIIDSMVYLIENDSVVFRELL